MANVKITDLDLDTAPASTDVLPFVDISSDETKKVTVEDLLESAGDGAVATPAFSFASDKDTGIYRPGADQLALVTGGTSRLFIDASGNIGVGIASPQQFLHVHGTNGRIQITSTGTGSASGDGALFGYDGTNDLFINNRESTNFKVFTAGTQALTINSSQRVGVGTSSPNSHLVISSGGAAGMEIGAGNASANGGTLIEHYNRSSSAYVQARTIASDFLFNAGTNSFVINSSGLVGINETSPAGSLHVDADSGVDGPVFDSGGSGNANHALLVRDSANSQLLRVNNNGNCGIGVSSPSTKLQLPNQSTIRFGDSGTAPKADISYSSTGFEFLDIKCQGTTNGYGNIRFFTGSTPSEAATITSSGQMVIGGTSALDSDKQLTLTTTSTSGGLGILSPNNGRGDIFFGDAADDNVGQIKYNHVNDSLTIRTNASDRFTIDSSGRLLLGTTSSSTQGKVVIVGNSNSSTGEGELHLARGATPTSQQNLGNIHFGGVGLEKAAQIICKRDAGTWTSGSSHPSRLEFLTTADGASSPTERLRIVSNGDVTTTGTSTFSRTNAGFTARNGDSVTITRNGGTPLEINRGTNDGNLVNFFAQNIAQGTITVSGSTVSYNGGHLARWSQLASGAERTEILRGSVLSNLDEMCEWGEEENEQLNRMKVSDIEGDRNVAGVFQAWDDDDDTYTNDFYCAMTGDFVIRIAQGTTVARGDLLMSAGDGTAKPQDDDIIRSKTIAKVTSTTVSTTYADGSYCVPCVLMAC